MYLKLFRDLPVFMKKTLTYHFRRHLVYRRSPTQYLSTACIRGSAGFHVVSRETDVFSGHVISVHIMLKHCVARQFE